MSENYFLLGTNENKKIVKIFQVLLGILCMVVAVFWLYYNFKSQESNKTLWITIIFLSGFGFYQVWAGMGRTTRFIEIESDLLRLKKDAILPPILIPARDIEKIELFPLNVIFYLKSKKKILLRFGTTYPEMMESIKDAIINFTSINDITLDFIKEEI